MIMGTMAANNKKKKKSNTVYDLKKPQSFINVDFIQTRLVIKSCFPCQGRLCSC